MSFPVLKNLYHCDLKIFNLIHINRRRKYRMYKNKTISVEVKCKTFILERQSVHKTSVHALYTNVITFEH